MITGKKKRHKTKWKTTTTQKTLSNNNNVTLFSLAAYVKGMQIATAAWYWT